jgi:transcriptional regulator with XRE-family HTH domain
MESAEKLNALQALLTEAYLEYVNQRRRKVGDNEFAKFLGVPVGSYNQWINGNRYPNFDNTIRLSAGLSKLNKEYGTRIFDILGYDRVSIVSDPEILFIADRWRLLDNETRKQIMDHIREESERDKLKSR